MQWAKKYHAFDEYALCFRKVFTLETYTQGYFTVPPFTVRD